MRTRKKSYKLYILRIVFLYLRVVASPDSPVHITFPSQLMLGCRFARHSWIIGIRGTECAFFVSLFASGRKYRAGTELSKMTVPVNL